MSKQFMSYSEIVDDILAKLDEEDRKYIQANRKEIEAVWFDSSFGRHIRNHYKLWHEDNPLTMLNYVPQMEPYEQEGVEFSSSEPITVDMNPRHPDNLSGRILQDVYARIRAQ